MGRVNSRERLRAAAAIGCDSADGTFLRFGPDKNLPRLVAWLDDLKDRPQMPDFLPSDSLAARVLLRARAMRAPILLSGVLGDPDRPAIDDRTNIDRLAAVHAQDVLEEHLARLEKRRAHDRP